MRGAFDDQELEPSRSRRDTELTLGSGTLLAIFFGLVLLCGLCFGLGYAVGHHGSQTPTADAAQTGAGSQPSTGGGSIAKPSATTQAAAMPPAASAETAQQPPDAASGDTPVAAAETLPAPAPSAPSPAQTQVHPALASTPVSNQPSQPAVNTRPAYVPTAQPPAAQLMVQIAAVSNTEDADVLTIALRRRGYAVTALRDPYDNLIHVRIGPFSTPAEANNWRNRLLNDGYNAIVQP
jgi:cell division septation protein DedD